VNEEDLAKAREARWDDAGIVEIIGVVVLNFFSNTFNLVAETELDFPEAPLGLLRQSVDASDRSDYGIHLKFFETVTSMTIFSSSSRRTREPITH